MKAKKLLAIVTAVTMIVLPSSTAFADEQINLLGSTVTQEATVNYVDPTDSIKIVVPTSASLAFTLDPQNLAATQGVGTWDPSEGGTILPQAVGIIANKSAVPVKAMVAFELTDAAITPVTLVDSNTNINDNTDKSMYMTLTPASAITAIDAVEIPELTDPAFVQAAAVAVTFTADELAAAGVAPADIIAFIAVLGTETFGQFVETADASATYNQVEVPAHALIDATSATTVSGYTSLADTVNISSMSEAGTSLAYVINEADYYVSKSGTAYSLVYEEQDTNTNYDTASFIIGGNINKNADWSDYDDTTKITLSATYSFETMTGTEATAALTNKLTSSYNSVETITPEVPGIGTITYDLTAATAVNVTVSLGLGSEVAGAITSVTYNDVSVQTLAASNYSLTGTTLTFTADFVDALIAADVPTRDYTVTFNNTAGTAVVLTFTYEEPAVADKAPSIATTSYTMTAATNIPVTVDLGTGGLAATGIGSITYTTTTLKTLDSASYTFEGGVLTFKSTYIDLVMAATTTRDYNIIFNDDAATSITITLTK